MELVIISIFIFGYLLITLEHQIKIDKLIPALIMMAFAWAGIALGLDTFSTWFDSHNALLVENFANLPMEGHENSKYAWFESSLLHHFGKTCEILIFLVGAMTIVEIIDHFDGFQSIKSIIKTKKKKTLLWIICFLSFILSAIIDNLTATIVLITILRKIIDEPELRKWYTGLIIIAANAGGAWSPIGDVTTTMLWMQNKVSAIALIEKLLLPSLICLLIPLFIASFLKPFQGIIQEKDEPIKSSKNGLKMLILGLVMIIFVPIFKTITHLPPYVGMMLALAIVSLIAEILSKREFSLTHIEDQNHVNGPTFKALSKIEMPSILFFLGILMTVAALESLGIIFNLGNDIVASGTNIDFFVSMLGLGSAIIDNVPLVAASMGMFQYHVDHKVWHLIAYAAGTGGSMLIIGSAAGVVAMGMEKISFFWYLKNISFLALAGYIGGLFAFLLFN